MPPVVVDAAGLVAAVMDAGADGDGLARFLCPIAAGPRRREPR